MSSKYIIVSAISFAAVRLHHVVAEVLTVAPKEAAQALEAGEFDAFDAVREVLWVAGSFCCVVVVAHSMGLLDTKVVKLPRKLAEPLDRELFTRAKVAPPAGEHTSSNKQIFSSERVDYLANCLVAAITSGRTEQLPGRLDEARAKLERSQKTKDSVDGQMAELFLSCVRACVAKRYFQEALVAYDHVKNNIGNACGTTWSILFWSAVECNEMERCSAFLEHMHEAPNFSQNDFVNVVRYSLRARDIDKLLSTLNLWRAKGFTLEVVTRNRALAAIVSHQNLDFAVELVTNTPELPLDAVAYNTLMKGYASADKSELCIHIYDQMRSVGIKPSEVTFGVLLDSFMGAGKLAEAKRVFEDLRTSGLAINVVHYTSFIKSLTSAGKLDEARELLNEMNASPSTKPDVITYSTLAKAYAEVGRVQDGLDLLGLMVEQGVIPDRILLNTILSSLTAVKLEGSQIFDAFNKVIEYGLEPSTATYAVMIKACAFSEAWDVALTVLDTAHARFGAWPKQRVYTHLAQACATAGHQRGLVQTYGIMVRACQEQRVVVEATAVQRFSRLCALCGVPPQAIGLTPHWMTSPRQ